MAFRDISKSSNVQVDEKRKLTELAIGESMTGYLLKISKFLDKETGEERASLIFGIGDKKVLVYPAGNIKYMIKDEKLTEGQLTRITREEDRKVGARKMKSTHFRVEQDPEDTVNEIDFVLGTSDAKPMSSPAPASKAAQERAATLAKAKRLE